MSHSTADIVICGAGIAGISAAYHLVVEQGIKNVLLVDERPPLSLTSDKSTECYRNWWPGPGDAMVSLMNRSIDKLEAFAHETNNRIRLNRRGYLFATADEARVAAFEHAAREAESLGAGAMRVYRGQPGDPAYIPAHAEGFEGMPDGADLILDQALIRKTFPYLTDETVAVVHARRCGWFSAQQLGMLMLERAQERGLRFVSAHLERIDLRGGRVAGVRLAEPSGATTDIACERFVNAAGPGLGAVGQLLGIELPIYSELHVKVAFEDRLGAVGREAPLVIWTDPTPLQWTEEERAELAESEETQELLGIFPAGVHMRPDGPADSPIVLGLWTFDMTPREPVFPIIYDEHHGEITLRGLATVLPELRRYLGRGLRTFIDGGYYTKTQENRPLVGPLPVEGAYIMGAFSGFGLMASCAAGELLAAHITGADLPRYAPAFRLERYADPEYQLLLANWGASGQL